VNEEKEMEKMKLTQEEAGENNKLKRSLEGRE
jgi:hypothetical protein